MRALTLYELRKMYGKEVLVYNAVKQSYREAKVCDVYRRAHIAGFEFLDDGSFHGVQYGDDVIAYTPDKEAKMAEKLWRLRSRLWPW